MPTPRQRLLPCSPSVTKLSCSYAEGVAPLPGVFWKLPGVLVGRWLRPACWGVCSIIDRRYMASMSSCLHKVKVFQLAYHERLVVYMHHGSYSPEFEGQVALTLLKAIVPFSVFGLRLGLA